MTASESVSGELTVTLSAEVEISAPDWIPAAAVSVTAPSAVDVGVVGQCQS
ncbi:MAG UNVERIFIED_CONTAM: hypothetical protein LVR18_03085 [Planctomycetaceae bacterium]